MMTKKELELKQVFHRRRSVEHRIYKELGLLEHYQYMNIMRKESNLTDDEVARCQDLINSINLGFPKYKDRLDELDKKFESLVKHCENHEYSFRNFCGVEVCQICGQHKGLAGCYCGWNSHVLDPMELEEFY